MKICEICKTQIPDGEDFTVDGRENLCIKCAEAEAWKAKIENREIEIVRGEFAKPWKLCQWCGKLLPLADLIEDRPHEFLCHYCEATISPRGKKLD